MTKDDIIAFVQSEFPDHIITGTGEFRINSCFTNDTKHKLYISPERKAFYDFKTDNNGSFTKFLRLYYDTNTMQALEKFYGEERKAQAYITPKKVTTDIYAIMKNTYWFSTVHHESVLWQEAYDYVKNRNLPDDVIKQLGFYYEPNDTKFHKRIIIPFYEQDEVVYFIARSYDENNTLRYNNPSGVSTKEVVYNIDKIQDHVFIFEGVFDALSLYPQVGTAILSAQMHKEQALKIFEKMPDKITLIPDNDETGKRITDKNIELLYTYRPFSMRNTTQFYIWNIPEQYKDFNEYSIKEHTHEIPTNQLKRI